MIFIPTGHFANPPYDQELGRHRSKTKTEAARPPFLFAIRCSKILSQPSRGMREQGVDEAGLRGQVAAQRLRPAVLARDLVEQALELGDVAVDRLLEAAV